MRLTCIAAVLIAATSLPAWAQSAPPTVTPSPVASTAPAAAEGDVASVDAIVKALYDTISGPAGKARDWNRLRSLFVPEARMMPVGKRATGETRMRMMGVNDYVATSAPLIEKTDSTNVNSRGGKNASAISRTSSVRTKRARNSNPFFFAASTPFSA